MARTADQSSFQLRGFFSDPVRATASGPAGVRVWTISSVLLTALWAAALSISAQQASPRATALGGAFWTAGNEGYSIFQHPALMSGEGLSVSFGADGGYGLWWDDDDDDDYDHDHDDHGAGGRDAAGHDDDDYDDHDHDDDRDDHDREGFGQVAMSATASWLGGVVGTGVALRSRGHSEDRAYPMGGREHLVALGYAREFYGVATGAVAKLAGFRGDDDWSDGIAVDLGVARQFGPVTVALTVQNLGGGGWYRHRDDDHDDHDDDHHYHDGEHLGGGWLEERVVLGAGTSRVPMGPLDVGAVAQVAVDRDGDWVPGGGVEFAWWPVLRRVFIGRVGLVRTLDDDGLPVTFGLGFAGDRIRVDYAYADAGDGGDGHAPHSVGLSIR